VAVLRGSVCDPTPPHRRNRESSAPDLVEIEPKPVQTIDANGFSVIAAEGSARAVVRPRVGGVAPSVRGDVSNPVTQQCEGDDGVDCNRDRHLEMRREERVEGELHQAIRVSPSDEEVAHLAEHKRPRLTKYEELGARLQSAQRPWCG